MTQNSTSLTQKTDKRVLANKMVKLKMARALTKLMETKKFSDITITEIVQTANVARASYYRNFDSKEEILIKVTDDILEDYKRRSRQLNQVYFSYDNILLAFRYFRAYRKFILSIYKAGFASIYLTMIDQHVEEVAGNMPYNDINRYFLYYYSGALYNVFLKWLETDMKESPEDMANMFYEVITHGLPDTLQTP